MVETMETIVTGVYIFLAFSLFPLGRCHFDTAEISSGMAY